MGIKKIIPDPYFTGGGLNVTTKGGLLDVHVDGNYHDATGLNRRLNAILYLNPNYKKDGAENLVSMTRLATIVLKDRSPV